MSGEIWKAVVGFTGYEVSDRGRVRSRIPSRKLGCEVTLLTPSVSFYGYLVLNLCSDEGKQIQRKVHQLVCRAFHGPAPEGRGFVNHKDGNKQNNVSSNLEWCTRRHNNRHAVSTGLNAKASDLKIRVHEVGKDTFQEFDLHAEVLEKFNLRPHVLESLLREYPHFVLETPAGNFSFEPIFGEESTNSHNKQVEARDAKTDQRTIYVSQRIAAIATGVSRFAIYHAIKTGLPTRGLFFHNV